jgi:hypothetical protein
MTKKTTKSEKTEEEVQESKENSKTATKAKTKNALKSAGDKLLSTMAADAPGAGQSKKFLSLHDLITKKKAARDIISNEIKALRAEMRGMKIDLSCYDRVVKLLNMEPSDVKAKKATEALYEKQLGGDLSDDQLSLLDDIQAKREENKKAILETSGGDTGKEIGTGIRIPARSDMAEESEEAIGLEVHNVGAPIVLAPVHH